MKTYSLKEWRKRGVELFGKDELKWKFKCPSCNHVASIQDYKNAEAPFEAIGFSCIGRWTHKPHEAFHPGKGPCNYAGGGLFRINPIQVVTGEKDGKPTTMNVFTFDGDEEED